MRNLKNKISPLNKWPLSPDEKSLLMQVYFTRRKLLFTCYAILFIIPLYFSFGQKYKTKNGKIVTFERVRRNENIGREEIWPITPMQMRPINIAFLGGPLLATGIFFYKNRVGCFKKDAESGVKYAVYEEVRMKQHFPFPNQYFIGLNDPDYLHHEVDETTYNSVNVGDLFPVFFAEKSQYAFNERGSFTIM